MVWLKQCPHDLPPCNFGALFFAGIAPASLLCRRVVVVVVVVGIGETPIVHLLRHGIDEFGYIP